VVTRTVLELKVMVKLSTVECFYEKNDECMRSSD
jgi:hypothetical protein